MIALGYYHSEPVSIVETYKDNVLIIIQHNPVQAKWVKIAEVDRIVWMIK